jgi:hypothetical protein
MELLRFDLAAASISGALLRVEKPTRFEGGISDAAGTGVGGDWTFAPQLMQNTASFVSFAPQETQMSSSVFCTFLPQFGQKTALACSFAPQFSQNMAASLLG